MLVFLSWSGDRSKRMAEALRTWLPDVIQSLEPWMSKVDIHAGARWLDEISGKLKEARAGIVCTTPENAEKPWLLFEAGALAKTVKQSLLCPYLLDLDAAALPPGPLTQFQAKRSNKEETLELVRSLNSELGDKALEEGTLVRAFDRCWPELKSALASIPAIPEVHTPRRDSTDMIEEILVLVRDLAGRPSSSTPIPEPGRPSAHERAAAHRRTANRRALYQRLLHELRDIPSSNYQVSQIVDALLDDDFSSDEARNAFRAGFSAGAEASSQDVSQGRVTHRPDQQLLPIEQG